MIESLKGLRVSPLSDNNILSHFRCGVPRMDQFLKGKFQNSIDNNFCKAFVVYASDNTVVGVYALNFDSLLLDDDGKEDMKLFLTDEDGNDLIDECYADDFSQKCTILH